MFQRLTNLFFGSLGDAAQEPAAKLGAVERDEEDWLLVTVPDGESSVEFSTVSSATSVSMLVGRSSVENLVASVVSSDSIEEPEVPVPHSSGRLSRGSQTGTLTKLVQVGRLQRAQAREDRYGLGHHCVQRQNQVQQRFPRRSRPTVLHQPSHRNFCH